MALPVAVAVVLVNLTLVAAGLLVFLPDPPPVPRRRADVERLAAKYGPWLVPVALVAVAHVVEIQIDAAVAERLRLDLSPRLLVVEGAFHEAVAAGTPALVDWLASAVVLLVHPATAVVAVALFVLTDEERAAKAALLAFPLAYGLALPFYLLLPADNVAVATGRASPLFDQFPDFAAYYYSVATPDNTLPAFHVLLAALIWNAGRYSRNRRFRSWLGAYAVLVVAASLLVGIHWITGVAFALIVALLAAMYTRRAVDVQRLALRRVKPLPEVAQRIREDGDALVAHVGDVAGRLGHAAKATLVGSVAKDTYLKDKVDYDVFVLFPPTTPRDALEKAGLEIGHAALESPVEKYAEHPYVHGRWRTREADVVPAYELDAPSARMTAVDRTPFHTRYVLGRMEREQRDETRLLKAFLVGVGAYGAEARVRGFSGYLCELLVLKFGSFERVVQAGARWKPGTFLVVDRVEVTDPQAAVPRFQDPLVVLDPVDPKRNAASAVAEDTLALFAEACRAYLARPGLSFFFPRAVFPLPPERLQVDLRRRRGELVLLRLPRPAGVLEDHLHDQVRKAARAAADLLEQQEFEVSRTTTELAAREARVLLELPRLKLSEGAVHVGPPLTAETHVARFRAAWEANPEAMSGVYEEDGRLKVKRRRPWRRADELLRERLTTLDLGKHLGPAAKEGLAVETGPAVAREDTALLVTRHLDRRRPWER